MIATPIPTSAGTAPAGTAAKAPAAVPAAPTTAAPAPSTPVPAAPPVDPAVPTGSSNPVDPNYNPALNYGIPKVTPSSITAPFGSASNGVPYGSQYSNNPNPDSSAYGANGNPAGSGTSGTGNATGTQTTGNPDVDALAKAQNDLATAAKQFSDTITGIGNGTMPLSAGDQAQISGLQSQFDQLIQDQQLQNTGAEGTANIRGYQSGAAEYDPTFQAKTIGSVLSAGANKILNLQIQEAAQVANLTQALQNNEISDAKQAFDAYSTANAATQAALKTTISDTQDAINDAHIQSVLASGITDPGDILSTLHSQGYDDISAKDISDAMSALSPDAQNILAIQKAAASNGAPQSVLAQIGSAKNQNDALTAAGVFNTTMIPDLQKLAEANGAPQSVIGAIGHATDSNGALQAAAGYTQAATGTLGDYLEYQRQAIAAGQAPEDYTTFENAQNQKSASLDIQKAVSIAAQEGADKAKIDATSGILSTQDSSRVNATISQLNGNKDVQAFMSIAGQMPILQGIPAGTTDPAEQSQLLASVAHILSPNSSSLRGALNAIDPSSLNSGVYNTLNGIAKTFDARGTLSPDAVNQLIKIGTDEYNSYLDTYQSIRNAATAPLASQGIDVDSYIPDYSNITPPTTSQSLQQQSDEAATSIANFSQQSTSNAALIKQLQQALPDATPTEIAQQLGLMASSTTQ